MGLSYEQARIVQEIVGAQSMEEARAVLARHSNLDYFDILDLLEHTMSDALQDGNMEVLSIVGNARDRLVLWRVQMR